MLYMILNNYLNNNAYYKEIASFSIIFIWDSFEILYNKEMKNCICIIILLCYIY